MSGRPDEQLLRVYCPAHRIHFQAPRAATIPCEADGHTLALNFPHEGLWEYCCDCQNFWPSELVRGGKGKDRCQNCERHTARRFLCDRCEVMSLDSDEASRGKFVRIRATVEPDCPGCLTRTAAAPGRHQCKDAAVEFLTPRSVCPFCQEPVAAGPAADDSATSRPCRVCGAALNPGDLFCGQCSAPREAPKAQGRARPQEQAVHTPGGAAPRGQGRGVATASRTRAAAHTGARPESPAGNGSAASADANLLKRLSEPATDAAPRRAAKGKKFVLAVALAAVLVAVLALVAYRRPADAPPPFTPPHRMAYVPGGEFMMGSGAGDEYERPPHREVVRPFYIDLYEVTCEEYAHFVRAKNHAPPSNWVNGQYPPGAAQHPVTGVTWDDARLYAEWAGKRLPTEVEWEFAARGTDGRVYPWGNEWKIGMANAGSGAGGGLADVGTFKGVSPVGAHDMVGNAWEWTATDLRPYPQGSLPDAPHNNLKVIRGGFWGSRAAKATTTFRRGWPAQGAEEYNNTGFRCAMSVPEETAAAR